MDLNIFFILYNIFNSQIAIMSYANIHTNSTFVAEIYTARKTLCEQLENRDYDITNYQDETIRTVSELNDKDELKMSFKHTKKDLYVHVLFHLNKKMNDAYLYKISEDMKENEEIIVVATGDPNKTITNILTQKYEKDKKFISVIFIRRLQFNILTHDFVPKHEIVPDKQQIYTQYNIRDDSQVPQISRFDPVAVAIGLRPGMLCQITRKSRSAIYSDYYRICV